MRKTFNLSLLAFISSLLLFASVTRVSYGNAPSGGTLQNQTHAVSWSGTVMGASAPSGEVPECAMTACERFDLTIDLPEGVWMNTPGGVEIAVRWPLAAFGDNLFLYVYKDGARIAKSDGVIASAQSVLIPQAENGLYTVYVAYDQLDPTDPNDFGSASPSIAYEGMADVEYQPKPHPQRQLLPDLVNRPQRNVTFEHTDFNFFEPPPAPGENCFPSEKAEEGALVCLRFDQVFANIGEGRLEMRFRIPHDPASPEHNIFQRVYRSDGGFDERSAGEWEFHAAHQHYHYTGFGLSRLWAADASGQRLGDNPVRERRLHLKGKGHGEPPPPPEPFRSGRKVSFCPADTELDAWLKKGAGPRTFQAPDCLFPAYSDDANDYLIQGITQGWADVYDWYLPDQFIEVSGVPDGYYILETIADPDNTLLEADETNNCGAVLIQLRHMNTSARTAEIIQPLPSCVSSGAGGR